MLKELCSRSAEGRRLVMKTITKRFFPVVHKLASFNAVYHLLKVSRLEQNKKMVNAKMLSQKKANFTSTFPTCFQDVLESFSSTSEVAPLEKLLLKHSQLGVLHQSLKSSFEQVATFERWIRRDQTSIATFFEKAQSLNADTLLNGNDDLGEDSNSNAIEDNFFDFEEFDRKKKK